MTRIICALAALAAAAAPAAAAEAKSNVSVYVGGASVSDGFEDRTYAGTFVNVYDSAGTGYHGDFAYIWREQDAAYASIGVSWDAGDRLRPKITLGTSSNNTNIAPEFVAALAVEFGAPEGGGWAWTPSITYRSYRSSSEETAFAVETVRYFDVASDKGGYYAFQARAMVAPNSSDETSYSLTLGLTSQRAAGYSVGLVAEAGRSEYDTFPGVGVQSDYWAVRPSFGIALGADTELFVRGEYADSDSYDVTGGMVGLKRSF